jgi:internalin A
VKIISSILFTLIVAQGFFYDNDNRSIAVENRSLSQVTQQVRLKPTKSFFQWCQQQKILAADTKHTIAVLLKRAGTNDCRLADLQLSNRTNLDLSLNKIVDIEPIASLTNLTSLDLSSNQISNLAPLAGLSKLNSLFLGYNQIADLKPLASLSNLTSLDLTQNKIFDLKSLAGLTKVIPDKEYTQLGWTN